MHPLEEAVTWKYNLFLLCVLLFLFVPVLFLTGRAFSAFLLQGYGEKATGQVEQSATPFDIKLSPDGDKIWRKVADIAACHDVSYEDREKKPHKFFACFFSSEGHAPGDSVPVVFDESSPEFAAVDDPTVAFKNLLAGIAFLYIGIAAFRYRRH